ncbi:MAG: hypothetical protein K1Y36_02290 [Blastocatellia bacterium]|nr:hypothetical protein [Blastocatellia bacterium]
MKKHLLGLLCATLSCGLGIGLVEAVDFLAFLTIPTETKVNLSYRKDTVTVLFDGLTKSNNETYGQFRIVNMTNRSQAICLDEFQHPFTDWEFRNAGQWELRSKFICGNTFFNMSYRILHPGQSLTFQELVAKENSRKLIRMNVLMVDMDHLGEPGFDTQLTSQSDTIQLPRID